MVFSKSSNTLTANNIVTTTISGDGSALSIPFLYNTLNAAFIVANNALPAASGTLTGTVKFNADMANQTLTDATTIAWNTANGSVAYVTLGGNRTMGAPTNLHVGTYVLHVIQDGAGSRGLGWNSVFKWPGGVAPTLTTTAGARDLFSFISDGTYLYGSFLPDVK